MKKIFLIYIVLWANIYAQEGWVNIAPGMQSAYIDDVIAVSIDTILFTEAYSNRFYKTFDGGETLQSTFLGDLYVNNLCMDSHNNIYNAYYGGLIKSTDWGDTWRHIDSSIINYYPHEDLDLEFYSIICYNDILYTAHFFGLFYSSDFGETWEGPILHGYGGDIKRNREHIFSLNPGASYNGFYISSDNGTSWGRLNIVLYMGGIYNVFNDSEIILYNCGEGIYYSDQNGLSWNFSDELNDPWAGAGFIDRSPVGKYFITIDFAENMTPGIYCANDPLGSWQLTEPDFANKEITVMKFDRFGRLFVGIRYEGLYYSNKYVPVELTSFNAAVDNNKITLRWKTVSELNNKGFYIERLGADHEWKEIGFVQGQGTTAEVRNYSFTDTPEYFGVIRYRLKQTDYDGSFEYSNIAEVKYILTNYELKQNYPNPFNPQTTIEFTIPQKDHIKLNIYNISGEHVAAILENTLEAGTHKILFDGKNYPSGVYLYKLEGENYSRVNKMILLK